MEQELQREIAERSAALREKLVNIRRDFYMHPELSREEVRTAEAVATYLRDLGLEVQTQVGELGVVGILRGEQPGPVVAYRADMDALPIQDELVASYRSLNQGVKHACGHDVHMTIALGVAEVLASLRKKLPGIAKFLFQPAEESVSGAKLMIEDGALQDPRPSVIFALHTFPIPVGQVGITPGIALPAMDEFWVRLYSPAGEMETLAANAVSALQALSNCTSPKDITVFDAEIRLMQESEIHRQSMLLSCWPFGDEEQPKAYLLGLVSIPDPEMREAIQHQIHQTLMDVTSEMGATYDIFFTLFIPPVYNEPCLVEETLPVLDIILGAEQVLRFRSPYPYAHEDFALYQQRIPGLFVWLGIANPDRNIASVLHAPDFDVDEDALVVGTRTMASVLWSALTKDIGCKESLEV
ncbi:MAG: amidohydrolase [Anaerolineae bacterium]|nr:amidohydrolase [Anaerolineae bacterium]